MSKPILRPVPSGDAPPSEPGPRLLRIVAGLHAGASRALAEQEMLVVGSGDDCDIVLADTGVAAHHALITLVGGSFTLRALDAPARIEGKPLHPGDPVEVRALQRIDLGEAAIAFGGNDEAAWDALFPAIADPARKRKASPFLRRLPLIAAAAVLALAAIAVVAAFLPRREDQVDVPAYLQALVPKYGIAHADIRSDVNGMPILSGTVDSAATRERVQQQLREAGVNATLSLRTGDDLASDVREVFRMAGLGVQTRYLGDSRVEIQGDIDGARYAQVLKSRAMADIGEVELVPGEGLQAGEAGGKRADPVADAAAMPAVDIVRIVRGQQPYVLDSNGAQYRLGDVVPGHGKLIGLASRIYVQDGADGPIKQIRPVTAAELAARAAAANFDNVGGSGSGGAAPPPSPPAVDAAQATMRNAPDAKPDTKGAAKKQ